MSALTLTGVIEMKAKLLKRAQAASAAVPEALYRQAEQVMSMSQPLVPVDSGALRSTGYVAPPEQQGGATTVRMGYGGPAADYAAIVHEDLDAQHPVGQAKYLEQPLYERVPRMADEIAEDIAAAIKASV